MTLQEIVKMCGIQIDPYVQIGMHDVLYLDLVPKDNVCLMNILCDFTKLDKLDEKAGSVLIDLANEPFIMRLEVFLHTQVFGKGPKVFRPTSFQLEMLENMSLNIEAQDFKMPYETIVVELPEEYAKARSITDFTPGVSIFHYSKGFMAHSVMNGRYALKGWWKPAITDMVEEWFAEERDDYGKHTQLPFTMQEAQVEFKIRRAICNYCLLLDEVGTKKVGPSVPNQYNQLVKWCQKNNHHTKKNKLSLQGHPIIYDLANHQVELVKTVQEGELPERHSSDRTVRPHSRRGYYKMQPYGPKNSLRKRIRVPSTIVNKHLIIAPVGATYRT